ncbi:hypothetical protein G6F66_014393 [Rhizopus arrhizus]|nr:hypothetical protein G6F66_014393 [Rhizopus arrhizus]
MAHGAEAESDGILGVVPVAHQRPAIGQQRVIAVHHTLGGAGGAGGEGQPTAANRARQYMRRASSTTSATV